MGEYVRKLGAVNYGQSYAGPLVRTKWDPAGADTRLREWASRSSGVLIPSMYRLGFGWFDPFDSDPDHSGTYLYPHHDVSHADDSSCSGLVVNLEALALAFKNLNSKTCQIPADDRPAVYEHLSRHASYGGLKPPGFVPV